jgi:hypothetical protein
MSRSVSGKETTMTNAHSMTRRGVLAALAGSALVRPSWAADGLPKITVSRDPSCGCCGRWVAHLKQSGFAVDVVETSDVNRVKVRLGVPQNLAPACHAAEVAGYAIEGHVPAGAIKRLLAESANAKGLAVPGMPVGSPGMEVEGTAPEMYEVILFGPAGQRPFARYHGAQEI